MAEDGGGGGSTGIVAVLAAFVPAQGAARVSPTVALREE